jgi:aflatoxin B1 aldehyde reductase
MLADMGAAERGAAEFDARMTELREAAAAAGLALRDAALRWMFHHSALGVGDKVLVGSSSLAQV